MQYARKLRKGDKVAIVSLSSGMLGEEFCSHNIEIGVKRLKEYGLEPVFMPNALKGIEYLQAHPQARAKDLKDAFLDNSIAGIICATKGNPDTYFKSKNGKYIFVAYTTQKDNLFEKAKDDIEKCLDPEKTGIQEKDIEEIIFCHTSSNLSAGEDKELKDICSQKGILFDIYGIDRIADEIYRKYKILAKDHLGMSIDTNQILNGVIV